MRHSHHHAAANATVITISITTAPSSFPIMVSLMGCILV
jgi:hypothetical protein